MLAGHGPDYVRVLWTVVSILGVGVLVALWTLYRGAAKRAELEVAERVIAEHDQSS